MRLLDSDLFDILNNCVDGTLDKTTIEWSNRSACCIILASAGYPKSSHKGDVIYGLENVADDVIIFHLGTKKDGENIVTNGGRVLGITATGGNLTEALKLAYKQIGKKRIHFDGMQYRKDIGKI
jgi:phosphoribosylamine--glycine ligase